MFAPVMQLALHWTPLLLLIPAAGPSEGAREGAGAGRRDAAQQVRIERRMSIRIVARPSGMAMDPIFSMPDRMSRPRIKERKMGKCLPSAMIGGMTLRNDNQLLFYLRNQRVVSATLEKACAAQNFYSGFYLARSRDGKLCVDRDTLLSRSGANCKVRQLRELVDRGR